VIVSARVEDMVQPSINTLAAVTIQNRGAAEVVFPGGSVVARGDALQAGGIAFQPLVTPNDYRIGPGEYVTLTLTVGNPCTAGRPGGVVFTVDPDKRVAEANDGNNQMSLPSVGSFAGGDLAGGMSLQSVQATGEDRALVPAHLPADIEVRVVNVGTTPAIWCPGVTLWRETESPVAYKYGLRGVSNTDSFPRLIPLSGAIVVPLRGAYQPGDVPPGTYAWKVRLNPDGRIPEANSANNVLSSGVTIR
jgi:hypothetical protein